ncbi:MAG: TRAP transporter small permease subunit [Catalinimonas sp.]
MPTLLHRVAGAIDRVNEGVGRAVSWLNTALVLLIGYDVLTRYAFNYTQVGVVEAEWHLFALVFLLGAGWAYKHDRHVRVDVFYCRLSPRGRAWVNLLGVVCFLLPFCWVAARAGWRFTSNSFRFAESSPDPGGLPFRYLIKAAIPLGFALLSLQGVAEAARALLVITERPAR